MSLRLELKTVNPDTIWNANQNHPEYVVQDMKELFDLSEEQIKLVRRVLLYRGVNKWLYCRYKFIQLKHEVKNELGKAEAGSQLQKILNYLNMRMQNIAKTPRWVEWGPHIHHKMGKNIAEVKIRGRHC